MDVILWRHAEAEPGEPDLGRTLTSKGEKQAKRVAQWLHGRLPDTAKIYSSPAKRAQQTAQALAEVSHRKVKTVDALSPSAAVADVLEAVGWSTAKVTIVVVGHQPTLGRVASHLVTGEASDWPIKKGGLVWISRKQANGGAELVLRAVMSPDLV
jgi:phosphohistidine phosphatase